MHPVDALHSQRTLAGAPAPNAPIPPTPPFRARHNPEGRAERSVGKRPALAPLRMPGPAGHPGLASPSVTGSRPQAANGDPWERPGSSGPASPPRIIAATSSCRERRSGITRELIQRASGQIARGEETLTSFATRHNLPRAALRAYVGPNGNLTRVGALIDQRMAHTLEDREREGLAATARNSTLARSDFRRAQELIGPYRVPGKISRTQFCELFGIEFGTVRQYFTRDGALTQAGKRALQWLDGASPAPAALAPPRPSSPAPSGIPPVSRAPSPEVDAAAPLAAAGDRTVTPARSPRGTAAAQADGYRRPYAGARSMAQMQQQLWEVCMRSHIALEFQLASHSQYMGMPRSPYLGELRMCGDYWSVYPVGGGHYQVAADDDGPLHAVNVLRLRQGGATALESDYVVAGPDAYGAVALTPRASTVPSHLLDGTPSPRR